MNGGRRGDRSARGPKIVSVQAHVVERPCTEAIMIVPDFPLANKSFNLSYAGNDL